MILVTGASGTVGSEVVRSLRERGASFRAGYRSRPQNLPPGVDAVALDYERQNTLAPALEGVDTVFLLSNTVEPERQVVEAAKRAGVRRIVKLSVMGAPAEEYAFGRWHRAVEKHVEASGLAWTFLRPTGFMQNVLSYMGETIRAQSAFYSSAGEAAIAHVDARDIGAVAARVLTEQGHDGKAYDLTGPAALTYRQIAEALSAVLGREIRYVPISGEQYEQAAIAAGTPEAYASALVDLERHYAEGKASRVSPAVRQVIGRDATPFEVFARDHAERLRTPGVALRS